MKYIVMAISALILAVGIAAFASYVGAYNTGNVFEQQIKAKYSDNQNVLSNYTTKVMEMAQVPNMYRDDLLKVITAQFSGRYGADGSKATWQWLQEQNLNLDSSLYTRIQQTMESGRNEFKVSQTELIDIKRSYQTALGSFWQGMWLRIAGYPRINLDDYKVIISADTTQKFESGVDSPITIRPQ